MPLIDGFTAARWTPIVPVKETGFYVNGNLRECSMRRNQQHVFENYRSEQFFIMEEPPGAGKSTTIKFVFMDKLMAGPTHKLIIAIPQTMISKSFGSVFLRYHDQRCIEWNIENNLCSKTPDSKINEIIRFMERHRFNCGVDERILITTHNALARTYDVIDSLPHKHRLFSNTSFVIDEAHHILYPENGSVEYANKIGRMVQYITEQEHPTTNLWLPSATFYRGDKASIIPQSTIDKFTKYFLPLDKHWMENILHIKSFSFDFVVYKGEPFREIRTLLKNQKRKTIIFCPYNGNLINGSKYDFKNQLVSEIRKVWKNANILDLVTEEGREERKQIIYDDRQANDIDIILSVRIFDEGADWIFAQQVIDLVPTNSLRVQGQRNGRLWRDCHGKEHISYYIFLPFVSKTLNEDEYRKCLSENYAAFTASLLIHESIQPIGFTRIMRDQDNQYVNSIPTINAFIEEVPDPNQRSTIIDDVVKQLAFLHNSYAGAPTLEKIKECVETTIGKHVQSDSISDIAVYVIKLLRRSIPKENKDVTWMLEAGFDQVWRNDIFDRILSFGTGVAEIKTFEEFRKVWDKSKTFEECFAIIEQLAQENNGKIPSYTWLKNNKYGFLQHWIYKYPDRLPFEQEKNIVYIAPNSQDDKIVFAEQLASEHGGILPSPSELRKMGLEWLNKNMNLYRDKYSHIPQKRKGGRTRQDKVHEAEKLAAENGGKLRSQVWLIANGFNHIAQDIFKCRRSGCSDYKHIIQEGRVYTHISDEDRIKELREVAEKNSGVIPSQKYLKENRPDLAHWMRYNKDKIDIKQEKDKRVLYGRTEKTTAEWTAIVILEAKNNNGVIPSQKYLKEKYGAGVNLFIQKHADIINAIGSQEKEVDRRKNNISRVKQGNL